MSKKVPNYAVSFASRYADKVHVGLNASVALRRLDMLLDDARTLSGHLDTVMPPDSRWFPWFGADVVSYYSVGYVTCLEWHARSRLVDLLSYKPEAVKADDVKQLRDAVVVEMLSANVTVADMIGASTNVSTFDAYMNIFNRVFEGLAMPVDGFQAAKAPDPDGSIVPLSGEEIGELKRLYEFRNMLVHEINNAIIGHPNVRESWTPEEAIKTGEVVDRLMKKLERALTRHAPRDFPHLLDEQGGEVSTYERLMSEISGLEAQIERVMAGFKADGSGTERDEELWAAAKSASSSYLKVEAEFVSDVDLFRYRYGDMREPLLVALAEFRHAYLKKIVDMVGSVWQVDPAKDSDGASSG